MFQDQINIVVRKGQSRAIAKIDKIKSHKTGFLAAGKVTFNRIIYNFFAAIEITNSAATGEFRINSPNGNQINVVLASVEKLTPQAIAQWDKIPIPGTAATATVQIKTNRKNKQETTQRKASQASKRAVGVGTETVVRDATKTPCESQGWPHCCPQAQQGTITLP